MTIRGSGKKIIFLNTQKLAGCGGAVISKHRFPAEKRGPVRPKQKSLRRTAGCVLI